MPDSPSHEAAITGKPTEAKNRVPPIDFEESIASAREKIMQCKKFITFGYYLKERAMYALRTSGPVLNEDDKEDVAALKRQWRDLLDNRLLEGAGEVLREDFGADGDVALSRLDDWRDGDGDQAVILAESVWKEVLSLNAECQAIKQEVDMALRHL